MLMITVRVANENDAVALSELCSSTYLDTYLPSRPALKQEFLAYLKRNYSVEKMYEKLCLSQTMYLIAEGEGNPVGYCHTIPSP